MSDTCKVLFCLLLLSDPPTPPRGQLQAGGSSSGELRMSSRLRDFLACSSCPVGSICMSMMLPASGACMAVLSVLPTVLLGIPPLLLIGNVDCCIEDAEVVEHEVLLKLEVPEQLEEPEELVEEVTRLLTVVEVLGVVDGSGGVLALPPPPRSCNGLLPALSDPALAPELLSDCSRSN